VQITFNTDEVATSSINYGLNSEPGYASTTISNNLNSGHSHDLTNLILGTEYKYQIIVTDQNDNTQTYSGYTFTTTDSSDYISPDIENITESSITESSARITFTTTESATSTLEYGLTTGYGSTTNITNYNSYHIHDLDNLSIGTEYHYRITATDENSNSSTTVDQTFSTIDSTDTTPPNITTTPSANPIADTYAVITWTTNENATSSVYYSETQSGPYTKTNPTTNLSNSHSINVQNLTENTDYYFYVESTDQNNNSAISSVSHEMVAWLDLILDIFMLDIVGDILSVLSMMSAPPPPGEI